MLIMRFDDEAFVSEKEKHEEDLKLFKETVTRVHAKHLFTESQLEKMNEGWLCTLADLRLMFLCDCGALNEDIGVASFNVKEEIKLIKSRMKEK